MPQIENPHRVLYTLARLGLAVKMSTAPDSSLSNYNLCNASGAVYDKGEDTKNPFRYQDLLPGEFDLPDVAVEPLPLEESWPVGSWVYDNSFCAPEISFRLRRRTG